MHGFKPITERDGINPTIYDWFNLCYSYQGVPNMP